MIWNVCSFENNFLSLSLIDGIRITHIIIRDTHEPYDYISLFELRTRDIEDLFYKIMTLQKNKLNYVGNTILLLDDYSYGYVKSYATESMLTYWGISLKRKKRSCENDN